VSLAVATVFLLSSCGTPEDVTEAARQKIISSLRGQGIYDRNVNVEELPNGVRFDDIKGYYDIIGGAYRHIVNENREEREDLPEIKPGDSISFYFDARILSGNYDNSTTYWTNVDGRIQIISNNNPRFNPSGWSTEPMRIKVGNGNILKAIDSALPSCRATIRVPETNAENEVVVDEEGNVVMKDIIGDEVRIFMPPDAAYGNKAFGVVPAKSTIAWELTGIRIIENTTTP
jgi:FKBP-type peptidyl-prolyl cis-trans isomerase 2